MKFSLVIPAFNEENAIANTIERCLAARARISAATSVKEVEVIVVSDGSTDQTAAIAARYQPDIKLIAYDLNQGYGAAISTGFNHATGELLSFMDADGTIDPLEFIKLIVRLETAQADICLGSRMGPNSEMPFVRWLGNTLYKWLVVYLSGKKTTDVASGMRVLRRSCLPKLQPLPRGMNFTPAMSARALMDPDLTIVEVPIDYAERIGRSKLNVLGDGFRFLRSILNIGISFRPLKLFIIPGLLFLIVALGYGLPLLVHYARFQNIPEDMIYRILFIIVSCNCGVTFVGVGVMLEHISGIIYHKFSKENLEPRSIDRYFTPSILAVAATISYLIALVTAWRPGIEYLTQGAIGYHWSRIALSSLFMILGTILMGFSLMEYALRSMHAIVSGNQPQSRR